MREGVRSFEHSVASHFCLASSSWLGLLWLYNIDFFLTILDDDVLYNIRASYWQAYKHGF